MRLFVALDLPTDAKIAIAEQQHRLAAALTSVRLVTFEALHVTLVFLGDVADTQVPAVADAIATGVDLAPFDIVFGGAGVFPPRGAPRALWIGINEGQDRVIALQQILADRL